MESSVSGASGGHDHNTKVHRMLLVVEYIYASFGLISSRAKFVASRTASLVSTLMIALNSYLSLKFGLIAILMFCHSYKLEKRSINFKNLNCTLSSYKTLMPVPTRNETMSKSIKYPKRSFTLLESMLNVDYLAHMNWAVDNFGGPYKLLGNQAALVYGIYSVALFIMLVIFPIELKRTQQARFNLIRFVMGDSSYMKDLLSRRYFHTCQLATWSRDKVVSRLTLAAMKLTNHHYLHRCRVMGVPRTMGLHWHNHERQNFIFIEQQQEQHQQMQKRLQQRRQQRQLQQQQQHRQRRVRFNLEAPSVRPAQPDAVVLDIGNLGPARQVNDRRLRADSWGVDDGRGVRKRPQTKFGLNYERLRAQCSRNPETMPSYEVISAHRDLRRFKPFVRSAAWHKATKIRYLISIIVYFIMQMIALAMVQFYFGKQLDKVFQACRLTAQESLHAHDAPDGSMTIEWQFERWSALDWLLYFEQMYTVIVISLSLSFYCSYYFGTMIELTMWTREISQQLLLGARVSELTDWLIRAGPGGSRVVASQMLRLKCVLGQPHWIDFFVNEFGGFNDIAPRSQAKRLMRPHEKFSEYRMRELMALRLPGRQTLLRATCVNVRLFLDELMQTHAIITTIMRRTTQIAAAFALMVAFTFSQLKDDHLNTNGLLLLTVVLLNIYLGCAAHLNNRVNKMLAQIHNLICALQKFSPGDPDILAFWLGFVRSFGENEDITAFKICGQAITWLAIISIDTMIFSIYSLTMD